MCDGCDYVLCVIIVLCDSVMVVTVKCFEYVIVFFD